MISPCVSELALQPLLCSITENLPPAASRSKTRKAVLRTFCSASQNLCLLFFAEKQMSASQPLVFLCSITENLPPAAFLHAKAKISVERTLLRLVYHYFMCQAIAFN